MAAIRGPRKVVLLAWLSVAVAGGAANFGYAVSQRALSVADAIGTRRINQLSISPDGTRYAAELVRGDLQRNGNWIELITGSLASLESAAHVATAAKLFTTSLGPSNGIDLGASILTLPNFNPFVWVNNESVALLYSDGAEPLKVIKVNLRTSKVQTLSQSEADVLSFAIDRSGAMVYGVRPVHSDVESQHLMVEGFSVQNRDAYSLLVKAADGYGLDDFLSERQIFVIPTRGSSAQRVAADGRTVHYHSPWMRPSFSPRADRVILDMTPLEVPGDWDRYTSDLFRLVLKQWRTDARSAFARQLHQLFVIDIDRAQARPLWNAPLPFGQGTTVTWSPDGRSVIVTGTFTPVQNPDALGLAGCAVAEVNVATGRFAVLPMPAAAAESKITKVLWQGNHRLEIQSPAATWSFRKSDGIWHWVGSTGAPLAPLPAIYLEIRQSLNTPPVIYAVERRSGRERAVFDPNEGLLDKFTLGRVEHITWPDNEGRQWSGLLYYPVNFEEGRRFPLVVQTHGHAPATEFSLYGNGLLPGLGPGFSAFAAQPLANHDIAVLQVEDKHEGLGTPQEAETHITGYDAGVAHLVQKGLVDENLVGIMGYSRTGWYVEQALTQSERAYKAAVSTEATDCSYLSYTFAPPYCGAESGGAPFGKGLATWLEHAPSFNVDRIYAALRLEINIGPLPLILMRWELFSRLRELKRPVELSVIPDIAHGTHGIQNPAQVLASKQGAVDWFAFWLRDEEDPTPAKTDQYRRWRELRKERDDMLKQPRPPRLHWTATSTDVAAGAP